MNMESKLGLDPADKDKKKDLEFYEWIAGKDRDKTMGDVLAQLFDELKEEKDEAAIRGLLEDWHSSCDPEEFKSRLSVLSKLMPEQHPFHKIKSDFS